MPKLSFTHSLSNPIRICFQKDIVERAYCSCEENIIEVFLCSLVRRRTLNIRNLVLVLHQDENLWLEIRHGLSMGE